MTGSQSPGVDRLRLRTIIERMFSLSLAAHLRSPLAPACIMVVTWLVLHAGLGEGVLAAPTGQSAIPGRLAAADAAAMGSPGGAAQGLVIRSAPVAGAPGARGGDRPPLGTALWISGQLVVRTGLRTLRLYHVRVDGSAAGGWIAAEAVQVTAGAVPYLQAAVNLSPSSGGVTAPRDVPEMSVPGGRTAAPQPLASDPPLPAWLPNTVRRWEPELRLAADEQGLDPRWLAIVVLVESGGWAGARSPAGAEGLMQVMPATAAEVLGGTRWRGPQPDPATPQGNLRIGAAYLARLARQLPIDLMPAQAGAGPGLAAAAYNAGPGRLLQHLRDGRPLPPETRAYQRWVDGLWAEHNQDSSPTLDAWRAAGGQVLLDAAANWSEAQGLPGAALGD